VLRLDSRAGFVRASFDLPALLLGRYRFVSGRMAGRRLTRRRATALLARAEQEPVVVGCEGLVTWWAHSGRFWRDDGGCQPADVAALVHERDLRERRRLDRAHALLGAARQGDAPRREGIPRELRALVWERDGGRCAECGTDRLLEFDHVIPVALGGSSGVKNLQLLCADCNRIKADAL